MITKNIDFYPVGSKVIFQSAKDVGSIRDGHEAEVIDHQRLDDKLPLGHIIQFEDGYVMQVHPTDELSQKPDAV